MMIIGQPSEFTPRGSRVSVTIGMFDGVHLGHQQILRQTAADARQRSAISLAITFDQHPNTIVAPLRTPPLIYSLAQRSRAIASTGIEAIWLIHFDREFSRQPAEEFVIGIGREFGPIQSVCIGADFTFGYQRSGNVALLHALGKEIGFVVHALPAVPWEGTVVSSTRIREAIQSGDLIAASAMLGRPYSVAGEVIRGDQIGRRLGFPTANLSLPGLVLPPNGVYAGYARLRGQREKAVANIGIRPTMNAAPRNIRFEVHVLDLAADFYGEEVEFEFVQRLRAEERFSSVEELREGIAQDVATARARLA